MKNKSKNFPGAENMDMTQRVRKGGKIEKIEADLRREKSRRLIVTVFIFSLLFSALYSFYYVDAMAMANVFADPLINKLLFGPGFVTIFDGGLIDQIFTILARGVFFMAVCGFIPYLTHLYARTRDVSQVNAFQLVWGMAAFLAFFIAFCHAIFWPLLLEVLENFSF